MAAHVSEADAEWQKEFDAGVPVLGNRVVTPVTEMARQMAATFVRGEFKQDLRALFRVGTDPNGEGEYVFVAIHDLNYPPFSVATCVPVYEMLALSVTAKLEIRAIGSTAMPWDNCPSKMEATVEAGGRVLIKDAANPHVYFDLTIPQKYMPVNGRMCVLICASLSHLYVCVGRTCEQEERPLQKIPRAKVGREHVLACINALLFVCV